MIDRKATLEDLKNFLELILHVIESELTPEQLERVKKKFKELGLDKNGKKES